SEQGVTWDSLDKSIATVTSTGLVTAVSQGSARIVVTTADGAKTATSIIEVMGIKLDSISFRKRSGTMVVGSENTLPVTLVPSTASEAKALQWTSSNPAVASIDRNTGKIFAKVSGTTTITARVDSADKEDTYDLQVFAWDDYSGEVPTVIYDAKSEYGIDIKSSGFSYYRDKLFREVEKMHFRLTSADVDKEGNTKRAFVVYNESDDPVTIFLTLDHNVQIWRDNYGKGLVFAGPGKGKITIHLRLLASKGDDENRIWAGKNNKNTNPAINVGGQDVELILYAPGRTSGFSLRSGGDTKHVITGTKNITIRPAPNTTIKTTSGPNLSYPYTGMISGTSDLTILRYEVTGR
ncbi:MAG: Ig-like domain-containing protein, partial [Treponemataceae bacterium]